jgi:two-component system chemotaxis response regulator CheY
MSGLRATPSKPVDEVRPRMSTMTDAPVILKLKPVLDLAAADEFMVEIRKQADAADELLLDASEVRTLTTPCVQIVLAAIRANPGVAVVSPSPEFVSVFADLALTFPQTETPIMQAPAEIEPADAPSLQASDDIDVPNPSSEVIDQPEAEAMAKRILTIDDSKTIRDMLRMTLVDAGYDVLQAVDGQDGVDVLSRETVDLVITDINMPKMNGYEVVRHLRDNPANDGLPILVLTTESDTDKKNIAREAGATGWMVKPFDPERLVATVRKVIP